MALHYWTECCSRINGTSGSQHIQWMLPVRRAYSTQDQMIEGLVATYVVAGKLEHTKFYLSVNPRTLSVTINTSNNMRIPESWKVSKFTHALDENDGAAFVEYGGFKTVI